jgi:transposase
MYVGLDVHKDTIAIAYAAQGRSDPTYYGEIKSCAKKLKKVLAKLSEQVGGQLLQVCYEAGPTGFVTQRQIAAMGHECIVIAPSKVSKTKGDRIKTDKRDALMLAKQLRSGDLHAVWIPDEQHEAFRNLSRCREDMKIQVKKCKQQLSHFVLRNGHDWPTNKSKWSKEHRRWLEALPMKEHLDQLVLQHYLHALNMAEHREQLVQAELMREVEKWNMKPVVDSLICLRGIDRLSAITLLAELGDLRRFQSPSQLMAYLGLVPSEHSSGPNRSQGEITRAGNSLARKTLVESAWSYRFYARESRAIRERSAQASAHAKEVGWKAQVRLCARYRTLTQNGKGKNITTVAIARELCGFIWDICCNEMNSITMQAK